MTSSSQEPENKADDDQDDADRPQDMEADEESDDEKDKTKDDHGDLPSFRISCFTGHRRSSATQAV
ncbi:hypothetical protein IPZ58_11205 [Streptomyces roseoverticillatus]|nr:hypothetical protein [Streptomyces roseoverticillatus]